ncbi:hypothetical protein [Haloarchaeobius iranensis]|uniref:Uncharacterized protein n=1 Tax=Haloarchaeobius iranensis TaxID=996166 RepID=A0A1G9YMJ1_9EURY|nr:hypothetical protein [Haloarchaeobius iranensis]SDN09693.1 hypothetical protein SAMN05192554_11515 [Haloarchaeobius iranensis]
MTAAALPTVLAALLPLAASSGGGGHSLPFVGPGTYLIFGIVLAPVYLMVVAWYVGEPSDRSKAWLGVGYLVGLTTVLWGSLFVATMAIDVLYF